MSVYFIQSREGLVKIGRSRAPEKRLRTLRCASPGAVLLGIREDLSESELHARFASSREAGEWFWPSPELLALAVEASGISGHVKTENALVRALRRVGIRQRVVAAHLGISESAFSRQLRRPKRMKLSAALAVADLFSEVSGRPWTLEELFGTAPEQVVA